VPRLVGVEAVVYGEEVGERELRVGVVVHLFIEGCPPSDQF
jgi:hypothetical protein